MPRVHARFVYVFVVALVAAGVQGDGAANVVTPASTSTISRVGGDPIFHSFHGQEFYAKGEVNKTFAMLSAPGVQVNARTSTGLENNTDVLWFSDVGVKAGTNFTLVVSIPRDDGFRAGRPTYIVSINGQDVSDNLFSNRQQHYGNDVRVRFFEGGASFSEPSTSPSGGHGIITTTPLVDVVTPSFKFEIMAVVDDAPWDDHAATPHLDIVTVILSARLDVDLVAGMLGETLSWAPDAEVPFHRGLLKGATDDLYEVSDLLAHNFAFATFEAHSALASGITARRKMLEGSFSSRWVGLAASTGRA